MLQLLKATPQSPCPTTREATVRSLCAAAESSPHSLQLEKAHRSSEDPGQPKRKKEAVCFWTHWVVRAVREAFSGEVGFSWTLKNGQAILFMEGTGFPGRGFALGLIVRARFLPLLRSPEKEILQPPTDQVCYF